MLTTSACSSIKKNEKIDENAEQLHTEYLQSYIDMITKYESNHRENPWSGQNVCVHATIQN